MKSTDFTLLRFEGVLLRKGLKCTSERKLIYQEVSRLRGHFDSDGLYEQFKKKRLRVSRATIFRTLPILLESGLIQKAAGSGKQEYFESTFGSGHHDHLICTECGTIIEFCSEEIEQWQERICREHGFELSFHEQRLFGKCKKCLK